MKIRKEVRVAARHAAKEIARAVHGLDFSPEMLGSDDVKPPKDVLDVIANRGQYECVMSSDTLVVVSYFVGELDGLTLGAGFKSRVELLAAAGMTDLSICALDDVDTYECCEAG
jgi:hypothetical protein